MNTQFTIGNMQLTRCWSQYCQLYSCQLSLENIERMATDELTIKSRV
jgi:hypothetical protein